MKETVAYKKNGTFMAFIKDNGNSEEKQLTATYLLQSKIKATKLNTKEKCKHPFAACSKIVCSNSILWEKYNKI